MNIEQEPRRNWEDEYLHKLRKTGEIDVVLRSTKNGSVMVSAKTRVWGHRCMLAYVIPGMSQKDVTEAAREFAPIVAVEHRIVTTQDIANAIRYNLSIDYPDLPIKRVNFFDRKKPYPKEPFAVAISDEENRFSTRILASTSPLKPL